MPPRRTPQFYGPIDWKAAVNAVTEHLGDGPLTENTEVQKWAGRRRAMSEYDRENIKDRMERYGVPNPDWKPGPPGGPPPYLLKQRGRGRKKEEGMHELNAALITRYPQLADDPYWFTLLEGLFKLDRDHSYRIRGKKFWDEDPVKAKYNHRAAWDRARISLREARRYRDEHNLVEELKLY